MRTVAKVRGAPSCQTRTVPARSVQKSRPSGANASAVANEAAKPAAGGDWPVTAHGSAAVVAATVAVAVDDGVAAVGLGARGAGGGDPQAATSAVNGDQLHGDFAGSGANARQPDPVGSDQFAGTSAKSRQIEKDLGVQ